MANSSPLAVAKANIEAQLSALQVKLDEVETRRNELLSEKSELEEQLERLVSAFPNLGEVSTAAPVEAPRKESTTKKPRKPRASGGKTNAMVDSMKQVMGDQTMSSAEVAEALTAAGLAPESKNLVAYVSSVFSASEDDNGEKVFVRESRGRYCVSSSQQVVEAAPAQEEVETVEEPTDESTSPAERLLNEVGLDSASLGMSPPA